MLFPQLIRLHDPEPHDPALNMAIDEVLLRTSRTPLFRVYRWIEPSVSFGYFGSFADAEGAWPDRAPVRRWTGGGVVPHGDDFTYTIIVPREDVWNRETPLAMYAAVHENIARLLGIVLRQNAVLAAAAAPKRSDACFENPAQHDVLIADSKVAGAAQRRTQYGLLHQGSIQMPDLGDEFADELAQSFGEHLADRCLSRELLDQARELAGQKYATEQWLRRF